MYCLIVYGIGLEVGSKPIESRIASISSVNSNYLL